MGQPAQFVRLLHTMLTARPIPREDVVRTVQEWSHEKIDWAVPRYFNSSSFRKEWLDRRNRLLPAWNFPVLLLQGREDPWQPYEFYEDPARWVPSAESHFVDAAHYYHLENPTETCEVIREFLTRPLS